MTGKDNYHYSMEDKISDFIVCATQLIPKLYDALTDRVQELLNPEFRLPTMHVTRCGSSEEFYIRPMIPCITDIDELWCTTYELAFEEDFPVFSHDVSVLADAIKCYKIEAYPQYPGFVRLQVLGNMNFNWRYKIYEFSHTALSSRPGHLWLDTNATGAKLRGPAVTFQDYTDCLAYDKVRGTWCPKWPQAAKDWSTRVRNYGWPTTDRIYDVVQNGCHVVYVQHRACKDDKLQWRFSFSVAELILLQSWTPAQQIVYHLLRYFSKRQLIQNNCTKEDEVLCPYHLKTLMLWTCEEMPPEWWNSSSVIAICCELLKRLSVRLKRRCLPNYFIPEANLFHGQWNPNMLERTEKQLHKFCDNGVLCRWFVENYILPFTERYFKVEVASKVTQNYTEYIQVLYEYRKASELQSLDLLFLMGFGYCNTLARYLGQGGMDARSCLRYTCQTRKLVFLKRCEMSVLPILENISNIKYFDAALYTLNIAYSLMSEQIPWDSELFADYVKGISSKHTTLRCQYHIFPKPLATERSLRQFLRAQDFMENITGLNSDSQLQILALISKEILRKALVSNDSQCNMIAPAAVVYLAALHFATSEFQRVTDLCSTVLMSEKSDLESETLNASCLFFIDDVVRIVGWCLLCRKINGKLFHYSESQIYLDLRIAPKVFSLHLTVMSAERTSRQCQMNPTLPDSALPLDQLLLAMTTRKSRFLVRSNNSGSAIRQCTYRRTVVLAQNVISTDKLIDALTDFALENMTSFYSAIRKDFGVQCNTIDCYRALYLYKCLKYDEVLHLCERILQESTLQNDLKNFVFANMLVLPPLDSFFDGDVQCLLGIYVLFHYLSSLNEKPHKHASNSPIESAFAGFISEIVHCNWEQLSDSLIHSDFIKFHFVIGRQFLASYLKVRCCIDCDYQCKETVTEFTALKIALPFEHVVRRFIIRKLHRGPNNSRVLLYQ